MNEINVMCPNLSHRTERRSAVEAQFADKPEFRLSVVPAMVHPMRGAWGLWQTFLSIVKQQREAGAPYFVFCEDDHTFTADYHYPYLALAIDKAEAMEADLLLGGVSWFRDAIQTDEHLYWTDRFNGMQFTVVFRRFYDRIISLCTDEGYVTDIQLSNISDRIFVMYPFISVQREFGYSDVTLSNNQAGYVEGLFKHTAFTFQLMDKVRLAYGERLAAVKALSAGHVKENICMARMVFVPDNEKAKRWQQLADFIRKVYDEGEDDAIVVGKDEALIDVAMNDARFIQAATKAAMLGSHVLFGGAGWVGHVVSVEDELWWTDGVRNWQVAVVFRLAFDKIFSVSDEGGDVEIGLNDLLANKLLFHPFKSERTEGQAATQRMEKCRIIKNAYPYSCNNHLYDHEED
ncbi:MAG: hypothetical protein IJ244_01210 [Bacteroidaceae bacterium]|nr:hypothetical protein [Bacteroidaceae bacterium]